MRNYIAIICTLFLLTGCQTNQETLQQQLDQLQEQNSQQEQENETLKQENEHLEQEVQRLNDENNQLTQKLEQFHRERISKLKEETGLVNIKDVDESIIIDLRYATDNNFVNQQVYPVEVALLQKDTAQKLKEANQRVKQDGYRIKVWDGYRPFDVQQVFWDLTPDKDYLADPSHGSHHNRGAAVDVTLVDEQGNEVEMPTGFDEFSERAWRSYQGNSEQAQKNMEYLTEVMVDSGFSTISIEWWHYNDSQAKSYPVLNEPLENFVMESPSK
ncbi:D-alanyl-D-alanine dipeptidase [Aquibacillus sediminis]|uniref:D-alanyl-D-alanine dipeptidase n=1 Tax=Aquibacillus sediminis TaxID=2574734 RepID=UPI00148671AD|nr:D-alanyl-D-alanine dipeptidase [Aquibacillus sediminis]